MSFNPMGSSTVLERVGILAPPASSVGSFPRWSASRTATACMMARGGIPPADLSAIALFRSRHVRQESQDNSEQDCESRFLWKLGITRSDAQTLVFESESGIPKLL